MPARGGVRRRRWPFRALIARGTHQQRNCWSDEFAAFCREVILGHLLQVLVVRRDQFERFAESRAADAGHQRSDQFGGHRVFVQQSIDHILLQCRITTQSLYDLSLFSISSPISAPSKCSVARLLSAEVPRPLRKNSPTATEGSQRRNVRLKTNDRSHFPTVTNYYLFLLSLFSVLLGKGWSIGTWTLFGFFGISKCNALSPSPPPQFPPFCLLFLLLLLPNAKRVNGRQWKWWLWLPFALADIGKTERRTAGGKRQQRTTTNIRHFCLNLRKRKAD